MSDMRPTEESTTIMLPVTFDYHGGRADDNKGLILSTIVVCVLSIFISIAVARSNKEFVVKLLILLAILGLSTTFLRFKTFREAVYSDSLETLKELNFTPPTSSFWGIYEVDTLSPHIARFKNGLKGIYVKLEKDVVVGKPDTIQYDHYEALSDAYNMASSLSMNVCHIDYMDNVGNDSRLESLYNNLNDVDNTVLKDLMLQTYSNLQFEMSKDYASYDVYLFTSKIEDENLWYNVREIIERLMGGNYISYNLLDLDGIRKVAMSLYNLDEFSAVDACNNAFAGSSYRGIVPIMLTRKDGTTVKLNDTLEEKRVKQQERLEEEMQLRKQRKERKSGLLKKQKQRVQSAVNKSRAKKDSYIPEDVVEEIDRDKEIEDLF